ncbi:hypothetical protein Oter_2730 [Opitutus terrae PB90-1]|uniref:Uncharacterized protein n=1 Tax=Opitutus terrae (strain DSM 11246 / JCM 15787 / PB90-1) TaxID=452637 RepID=B1ZVZ5_OPITP|nr:hypothetical protein Oter_2730 [Opitutus terrae PB90-1]
MLLLPWLFVAALLFFPRLGREPAPATGPAPQYDEYVHKCRPGPWGELQYSRIVIEPPDEFAVADYSVGRPTVWNFLGYSRDQLTMLWREADLSPADIALLEEPGRMTTTDDRIVIRPPDQWVLDLSTAARTRIYSALAAFPENPDQQEPFRFRADTADEWLENSQLAPETIQTVTRLLYRRGSSLLFSDHNLVLPRLASNAERIRLVKVLARKSTLLVKLRIRPDSDLDTLTDYWGRGPRRKGMRALLESISHRREGITIDVAHLLPRFPRAHLFTYPQPPEETSPGHDCHWTSMNFFNDPPDERFSDAVAVQDALENDYVPVSGRLMMGDILVFMRDEKTVVHSCVHIADDIVFTKNGSSEVMPWILMNLSDVAAFYPADPPLTIRAYRRKDL